LAAACAVAAVALAGGGVLNWGLGLGWCAGLIGGECSVRVCLAASRPVLLTVQLTVLRAACGGGALAASATDPVLEAVAGPGLEDVGVEG
jgi:hypothetical protein